MYPFQENSMLFVPGSQGGATLTLENWETIDKFSAKKLFG